MTDYFGQHYNNNDQCLCTFLVLFPTFTETTFILMRKLLSMCTLYFHVTVYNLLSIFTRRHNSVIHVYKLHSDLRLIMTSNRRSSQIEVRYDGQKSRFEYDNRQTEVEFITYEYILKSRGQTRYL